MITIKAEFEMTTELGTTRCTADEIIFHDYRDIYNVEKAIKYVKKLFNSKKFRNKQVEFIADNDSTYGFLTRRYYCMYSEEIDKVIFRGKAYGDKYENIKLTTKEIKEAYLECADFAMDFDEKAKENAI